jgi:hypothetical protein
MDLEAIEARANAVKGGPWELEKVGDFHDPGWMIDGICRDRYGLNSLSIGEDKALGEFIVAARMDVPALVARVRELEEENKKLRHDLAVARGETFGNVPTWSEYAQAQRAKQPPPEPKPHVTLEVAREINRLDT